MLYRILLALPAGYSRGPGCCMIRIYNRTCMLYRQTFPRLRNRGRTYRNAPVTRSRMKQRILFRLKKKKEGEGKKKKYLTNNFHYSHFIINFYVHHEASQSNLNIR